MRDVWVQLVEMVMLAVAAVGVIVYPSADVLTVTRSPTVAALIGVWLVAGCAARAVGVLRGVVVYQAIGLYSSAAVLGIFGLLTFAIGNQKPNGLALAAFGVHLLGRAWAAEREQAATRRLAGSLSSLRREDGWPPRTRSGSSP